MEVKNFMSSKRAKELLGNRNTKLVTVTIDTESDNWELYQSDNMWMDYAFGAEMPQYVVIKGNRDYKALDEAEWWQKADGVASDFANYGEEAMRYYRDELTRKQRKKLVEIYKGCWSLISNPNAKYCIDDDRSIFEIAKVLYPNKEFGSGCIKGCYQGNWQDIYYIKKDDDAQISDKTLTTIEEFYFGEVSAIHVEDGEADFWDYINNSRLWDMERSDNLGKEIKNWFGIGDKTDIIYIDSDGDEIFFKYEEVA